MITLEERRARGRIAAKKFYDKKKAIDPAYLWQKTIKIFCAKYNVAITWKEYNALIDSQQGGCAICNEVDKDRRLAIDHNHETGEIRGLLCRSCNQGIGQFRDNPAILLQAYNYISKY